MNGTNENGRVSYQVGGPKNVSNQPSINAVVNDTKEPEVLDVPVNNTDEYQGVSILERYGRDLTAVEYITDPSIGRDMKLNKL